MNQHRIVCAANRDEYGNIVLGVRHYDQIMHSNPLLRHGCRLQGFIDNRGQFLTRRDAWKVAEAAGQIIRRVGGDDSGGGTLYSENLY